MDLTPTRFTTVHDTTVTVAVGSADEARHAIKELRHLKRELAHHKRGLRAALLQAQARERREARRKPEPALRSLVGFVGKAMGKLVGTGSSAVRRPAPRASAEIRSDIARIDALLRSIDGIKLEIEGRLLQRR